VVHDTFNVSLFLQVSDSNSRKTAVDFQSFDEDGLGDEPESRHFLHDAVEGGLVKRDGMAGLVLDLALGPLLLLRRLSS